jgi:hypothetical protein
MATADPPPEESSDELGRRPTLTQHQSSRGNRLASDDPSAPGTRGRLSVHRSGYSCPDEQNRSGARQRFYIIIYKLLSLTTKNI